MSGRLLADICRSLPSAPVEVETDGNKVTLTCRRSSFHLATMPEAEYPPLPSLPPSAEQSRVIPSPRPYPR